MSIRLIFLGFAVAACSSHDPPGPSASPSPRIGRDAAPIDAAPLADSSPDASAPIDAAVELAVDHRSSTIAEPFKESPLPEKPTLHAEATMVGDWVAAWSAVKGPPGCFFFSGPTGRDTPLTGRAQLSIDGEYAKLALGGATFEGSVQGATFSLSRHATHTYGGTWTVTETLTGIVRDRSAVAKYHYQECSDEECPGHCTIDATLTLEKR